MSSYLTLLRFLRAISRGFRDRDFRGTFITLLILLIGGTAFYAKAEGWSWFDALYICVMTLSTVGYGDPAPTTTLSKALTISNVLVGAGVFVSFITKLARQRRCAVGGIGSWEP